MAESLKNKIVKGVFWSTIDNFSSQGIQFLFSIVLARLLSPSDYGIIAMVVIFFAIAQAFVNSGFLNALIRKKDCNETDFSTCFYFNIIVGIGCYIILFLVSPLIASFYNQPILSAIVKVSGLNILLNSLCIVQQAHLTRNIDFKKQAKITVMSTVLSGLLGITLAYLGYGVWALVWQGVSSAAARMVLLWVIVKWRPKEKFSKESFHDLFGFGSKLLASGLLDTIYTNIYPIVIGKFYTPAQLGNFSRAQQWAALPSSNLTSVFQRVTFPVLSLIQDDMERLQNNYRRLLKTSAFVVFPLMMLLAGAASPIVRVILTPKWDGCVVYLEIICFSLMWYPIHAINLNLLQVKGRSDLFLKLEIIKKVVITLTLCVTIPLGIIAMCFGMVFTSFVSLFINTYYTGKLINVGFSKQMRDLLPVFATSVISGLASYLSTFAFEADLLRLLVSLACGSIMFLFLSYIFTKSQIEDVRGILKRKG